MDLSTGVSRQNIEKANWLPLSAYFKVRWEKSTTTKKELFHFQAEFRTIWSLGLAGLKNKTSSHVQLLRLAQSPLNRKWTQTQDQIQVLFIKCGLRVNIKSRVLLKDPSLRPQIIWNGSTLNSQLICPLTSWFTNQSRREHVLKIFVDVAFVYWSALQFDL